MYIDEKYLTTFFGQQEINELKIKLLYKQSPNLETAKPLPEDNTESVKQAIEGAGSIAKSYIARRYIMPLTFVPAILKVAIAHITRYYLHTSIMTIEANVIFENYKMSIEILKDISNGKFFLVDDMGQELLLNDNSKNSFKIKSEPPVYTAEIISKEPFSEY